MAFLDSISLSNNFKTMVIAAYSQSNFITWQRVIDTFGSHFVESATFGGR
jgi:hypothetical protein